MGKWQFFKGLREGNIKMSREVIRNFIIRELCEDRTVEHLRDDEPLIESGIIDSLGVLKLLAFLDETFGIIASEEELNPEIFSSINSLCDFVESKKD